MSKFKTGDIVNEKGDTALGMIVSTPGDNSEKKYEVAFSEGTLFLPEENLELNAEEGQPPIPEI